MRAKPVIDLMIGVLHAATQEDLADTLAQAGWSDLGEAGVPGRRHMRWRKGNSVNIHIVLLGSSHWRNNLAVRDFLSAHADERARYAAVKEASVAAGADRLLAYSDRKASFMVTLLERAMTWRDSLGNSR